MSAERDTTGDAVIDWRGCWVMANERARQYSHDIDRLRADIADSKAEIVRLRTLLAEAEARVKELEDNGTVPSGKGGVAPRDVGPPWPPLPGSQFCR